MKKKPAPKEQQPQDVFAGMLCDLRVTAQLYEQIMEKARKAMTAEVEPTWFCEDWQKTIEDCEKKIENIDDLCRRCAQSLGELQHWKKSLEAGQSYQISQSKFDVMVADVRHILEMHNVMMKRVDRLEAQRTGKPPANWWQRLRGTHA